MTSFENPQLLAPMQLKQSPPAVRTIITFGGVPLRLAFPWISIGYVPPTVFAYYGTGFKHYVIAYFHNKPWNTVDEAAHVIRCMPFIFHSMSTGFCCCGPYAERLYAVNRPDHLTPSEVFWNTNLEHSREKTVMYLNDYSRAMLDIKNPKKVLEEEWEQIGWTSLYRYIITGPRRDALSF